MQDGIQLEADQVSLPVLHNRAPWLRSDDDLVQGNGEREDLEKGTYEKGKIIIRAHEGNIPVVSNHLAQDATLRSLHHVCDGGVLLGVTLVMRWLGLCSCV